MTDEAINAKIEHYKAMLADNIRKKKQKAAREAMRETQKKRKLADRVKYIIGGYILTLPDAREIVASLLKEPIREQDKDTIKKFLGALQVDRKI